MTDENQVGMKLVEPKLRERILRRLYPARNCEAPDGWVEGDVAVTDLEIKLNFLDILRVVLSAGRLAGRVNLCTEFKTGRVRTGAVVYPVWRHRGVSKRRRPLLAMYVVLTLMATIVSVLHFLDGNICWGAFSALYALFCFFCAYGYIRKRRAA
jgi:hypothetical protein